MSAIRTTILRGTAALAMGMAATSVATADETVIFDGGGADGWINNNTGEPIASSAVQDDGLNPHGTGAYVILFEEPVKDFVLDFDYKLSAGCNSGVFIRVGDMKDPVMTGLEVALDDTDGAGIHDSGALYDLAAPSENAQEPDGAWNHMTITAEGPIVTVVLNDVEVNRIDQSKFTEAGKRPDGSDHKFREVVVADLAREGYLGFQDHGSDVWYKNIRLETLDQ